MLKSVEQTLDVAKGRVEGLLREGSGGGGDPSGGKKFKKRRWRYRMARPVLVVCAIVAVVVALDHLANYGRIYANVEVGPVVVGGETPEGVRGQVEGEVGEAIKEVRLSGPEDVTLSDDAMGASLDVDATLERAYAFGREGSIFERLAERLYSVRGTARVDPVIRYDADFARDEVEKLAQKVNVEPQEGTVTVSGDQVEVGEAEGGYELDVEETLANVKRAVVETRGQAEVAGRSLAPEVSTVEAQQAAAKVDRAVSAPVTLSVENQEWELSPAEIGQTLSVAPDGGEMKISVDEERMRETLAGVYEDVNVEPVEPRYEIRGEKVVTVEGKDGTKVESEALVADLESGLLRGQREYVLPVTTSRPKTTTEEARRLGPTDLLGAYRTNYTLSSDKSPERVENLAIASDAVSGTLLAPGETFSFNELAAPLAYNETHVIVEGRETSASGGGLCQVASTLFNAANYAGMEIVERNPHHSELPYIRPGLDATVWFGSLDMRFKNTTDGFVLVQETVEDDGYIYASIYGRPNGTTVEMASESTYRTQNESEWVTYKTVTRDGKTISDGPIFTTNYTALIDEHGRKIAPIDLEPAPVIP